MKKNDALVNTHMSESIISVTLLKNQLKDPNLVILDASQKIVQSEEASIYQNSGLTGARYFDLKNAFSYPNRKYSNTFPSAERFQKECRNLGINQSSRIVVYDNIGVYTSPRVWWMFKAMGHDQVQVLDGGLPAWIQAGFEIEAQRDNHYAMGDFIAKIQPSSLKGLQFISSNISNQNELLIDARSIGRFEGTAPEPREGLPSGHIPGSINIPFKSVLENDKFKSKEALAELFKNTPIANQPLIFSCGSGVTACIVLLAADQVLDNPKSVYDGSWTEWASELRTEN